MKRIDLIRLTYRFRYFLLFIGSVFFSGVSVAQVQTQRAVAENIGSNIGGFYESLPVNYDAEPTKKYPLIIFLHGAGEVGNGTTQISKVAANGIPKLIAQGKFPSKFTVDGEDFSFIVMSPQCKIGDGPIGTIVPFLSYVLSHYRVDEQRIYLTGLSLGGYMSWNYAAATVDYAKKLAALLLVCPGIDTVKNGGTPDPHGYANNVATAGLPTWITTNSVDPEAYTYKAVALAQFINQNNPTPPARLSVFPETGHDAWTKTYNPDYREDGMNVYEWMLKYKRGSIITPSPPVANAGSPQTITLPTNSITLNGTASTAPSGTISSYSWTKISGPSSGTISTPSGATTTVNNLTEGTYQFQLTITDNNGKTASAAVSIVVKPAPLPPVANAGNPQTITLPANSVTLNGSASTAPSGTISSYQWTKSSGPSSGTITSNTSAVTTVSGLTEGVYVFQLKVTDNNGATSTASVSITVNAAPKPPVAAAGNDQTIQLPVNSVSLDGSKSTAPSGSISTYLWTKVSGPSGETITNKNNAATTVTGLTEGTYEFKLTVTDNLSQSSSDIVIITVKPAPPPPVADAGSDATIQLPVNSFSLDGSKSTAPGGSITDYEWIKSSGPSGGTIADPHSSNTTASNMVVGVYVFQLKVTDNNGNTSFATVSVTVKAAPLPPVANAGADKTITLPDNSITLDGTASTAPSGTITSYTWAKSSGPATGSIVNPSASTTKVNGLEQGVYKFTLTVTDNNGGSSSGEVTVTVKPAVLPPVANAGTSISITLPVDNITLDGTASTAPSGTIVSYAWKKISGPASAIINNTSSAVTDVTALVAGEYNFELTVTDNNGKSATAVVTVNVNPEILQPVANAGNNGSITLPQNTVTLDGTASTAAAGFITKYLWTKVSGPTAGTISDPSASVTSASGLEEGVYEFELKITDNNNNTAVSIVTVTVLPQPVLPIANAGASQSVTLPQNSVTLDGSASSAPSGTITAYTWTKVSGPADGIIENVDNAVTQVNGLTEGIYEFELKVTDNNGAVATGSVTVTVNAAPLPPVANAGSDQTISLPVNTITLDANASTAPAGNIVSYEWAKISGPAEGNITDAGAATTEVTGLAEGVYVFEVTITDNNGAIAKSTVTINVNAAPLPPVANAGSDQTITLPQNSIALDGTASSAPAGNIADYLWTKISGPSDGSITSADNAATDVTGLVEGIYKFQLKVTDNNGATSTASITVTVKPAPLPPVANAGSAQTITLPSNMVTLDGSKSAAPSGTIKSYHWTKISGPASGAVASADAAITEVNGLAEGEYKFELKVTDNIGAISTATVTVTVKPAPLPPVANAGSSQTIQLPVNTITLDGTKSSASSGTIVSYLWTKISGPSAGTIADAAGSTTVVNDLKEGVYTFELKITDSNGATSTATVNVTVKSVPLPPVANAGKDLSITLPQNNITLDGTASTAPSGTIVSFAWTKISGPAEGSITDAGSATTTAADLAEGVYRFQLKVVDNNGLSSTSTITVTVKPAPLPPLANAGKDLSINLPQNSITLDGTTSTAPSGTIVSFAWTKISGPAAGTIADAGAATTAVNNLTEGEYTFELKVTDSNGATATVTVTVTVNAALLPPIADAGGDRSIILPENNIDLDGSASAAPSGTILTYTWTKISGPGTGAIGSPSSAVTKVSGLSEGVYKFQLKITDSNGMTATDLVTITVKPAPQPPVANAGNAQTIVLPVNSATLDGTKSTASSGYIISYEWTQLSGPSDAAIENATSAATTVNGLAEGEYTFELKVTDNNNISATASVTIIVKASPPPPAADAGNAITVVLPVNTATLDGSKSTSSGSTIISYEWSILSGPEGAGITDAGSKTTQIVALVEGNYQVQLKVTDNLGASATTSVSITVKAAPVPPVANAGAAQTITLPVNTAQLDATKSSAPAGKIKTYLWTKLSGPQQGNIVDAGNALTQVENLVAGTYEFQVKVTDNNDKSSTATVTIIVKPAPVRPPVANAGDDFTVQLPVEAIHLDGSKSYARDGSIASYHWILLGGTTPVTILNAETVNPNISSVESGIYIFRLYVTDTYGSKDSADIAVNVLPEDMSTGLPEVNIKGDTIVSLPQTEVMLDGTASAAESGSIEQYEWKVVSGPSGAVVEDPSSGITKISGLAEGQYEFELTVTDSRGKQGKSVIKITVNNPGGRQDLSTSAMIYPNPTQSQVNIQLKGVEAKGRTMLDLYDANGRRVLHKEVIKDDVYFNQKIDLSGLKKGIYFLEIIIDYQYRIAQRIVKL